MHKVLLLSVYNQITGVFHHYSSENLYCIMIYVTFSFLNRRCYYSNHHLGRSETFPKVYFQHISSGNFFLLTRKRYFVFSIAGNFFHYFGVGMYFLRQNMKRRNTFMSVLHFKELEIYPSFFEIFVEETLILFSDRI